MQRRSTDNKPMSIKAIAMKFLYVLIIVLSLSLSYWLFWHDDWFSIVMSVLCCVPAGIALVELFPGKWEGDGE